MTTLGTLKDEVADDLDRPDLLTTSIPTEITSAIRAYQGTRFYFNETRDCVIATAENQRLYTASDTDDVTIHIVVDEHGDIVRDEDDNIVLYADDETPAANLSDFIEIDQVIIDGEGIELDEMSPKEWEVLTSTGASTGKPTNWCYFGGGYGFYPIPDQLYPIRFTGHIKKAAPADDDEADNVWMVDGYELIRARVCARLGLRKIRDPELAAMHTAVEREELLRLNTETTSKVGTGFITPTEF